MEVDRQGAFLLGVAIIIATIAVAYYHLSSVLSQTDQVLSVWEYIAETPVLCNNVSRIFTMLMKVRIPFSRAIGSSPFSLRARGLNARFPDHIA